MTSRLVCHFSDVLHSSNGCWKPVFNLCAFLGLFIFARCCLNSPLQHRGLIRNKLPWMWKRCVWSFLSTHVPQVCKLFPLYLLLLLSIHRNVWWKICSLGNTILFCSINCIQTCFTYIEVILKTSPLRLGLKREIIFF